MTPQIVLAAILSASLGPAARGKPDPWSAPRTAVFGETGGGWKAVALPELAVREVPFPPEVKPQHVTASADGHTVFFTAFDSVAQNVLLFRRDWDVAGPARRIGDSRGYHSDPVVSPDGQWVYFAHNPDAHGPAMQHPEKQAYAQIYRVHPDGSGLEALTN